MAFIFRFFTKLEVIGKENLKKIKGPAIFISNHESYFDPCIIGASIPVARTNLWPVYFLAHDEKFENKLLNAGLRLYGAFPGRIGEGVEKAIKKPLKLLKQKKTICIFPEGCYDHESEINRMRELASLLSIKTGTPIVPVFIYGIYDGGISWKKILNRGREVKVIFGEPIYPDKNMGAKEMTALFQQSLARAKVTLIKLFHEEEKKFWGHYAKFYHHLEESDPYKDLLNNFKDNLPKTIAGRAIDLGSGSGAIVELLVEKSKNSNSRPEILATDIESRMLDYLSDRFHENKNVKIKEIDLAQPLEFTDNYFNCVTANLVLPYLIHHRGEIGLKGFVKLLEDVHRVLKSGGHFIWSTPKKGVKFFKVFTASWRNMLDPKNLDHLYYGPAIFRQALRIQNKGYKSIYHFLDIKELEKTLADIGFTDIEFTRSMANQVEIIRCKKI
jgi:1-acyl-sn-glycerol-3-phosphate acyltransferase